MVKFMKYCLTTALFVAKLYAQERSIEEISEYTQFNGLAKEGNLDAIRSKLEHTDDAKSFVNSGDHWEKNTIHYAAEHGHADVINSLWKDYGADIAAKDYRGRTALHLAASKGNIDSMRELMKLDNNLVNMVDKEGKNALHYAAETGQYLTLKTLVGVDANKINVNSKTDTGKTALMIAAERGHIDFVNTIIGSKYGADKRAADVTNGMTALMFACKIGHLPIVNALVDTMNQKDAHGRTPLHYAVISGQSGLVHWILKNYLHIDFNAGYSDNAFLTQADSNGVTALHLAAKYGYQSVCIQLLNFPNLMYATDNFGQTPLHLAIRLPEQGFTEILEYHTPLPLGKYTCLDLMLAKDQKSSQNARTREAKDNFLNGRSFVNVQDRLKHTAMSRAVEYGCIATINRLFKFNNPETREKLVATKVSVGNKFRDMNMIHYAVYSNQLNIIDTLIRHGVERAGKMHEGMTPLMLAVKQNNKMAVAKMLHYQNEEHNFLETIDKGSQPRTALIWAAIGGNVDILKSLIGNKANLEFEADKINGKSAKLTALHFAAAKGDAEVVNVLLHAGANYDALDINNISPLDTAIYYQKEAVLKTLLLRYQHDLGGTPEGVAQLTEMFDKAIKFTESHSYKDPGYNGVTQILEDAAAKHYEVVMQDFASFEKETNDYQLYYNYYYDNNDEWAGLNVADYEDINYDDYNHYIRKRRSARAAKK